VDVDDEAAAVTSRDSVRYGLMARQQNGRQRNDRINDAKIWTIASHSDRRTVQWRQCGNVLAECRMRLCAYWGAEIRQPVKIFCARQGCRGYKLWTPQDKLYPTGNHARILPGHCGDISNWQPEIKAGTTRDERRVRSQSRAGQRRLVY